MKILKTVSVVLIGLVVLAGLIVLAIVWLAFGVIELLANFVVALCMIVFDRVEAKVEKEEAKIRRFKNRIEK